MSEVASSGSTRKVCGCGCNVPVSEVASSGSTRRVCGCGCYLPVSEVASSGSTRRVCGCGCNVPVSEVASSGSTRRVCHSSRTPLCILYLEQQRRSSLTIVSTRYLVNNVRKILFNELGSQ